MRFTVDTDQGSITYEDGTVFSLYFIYDFLNQPEGTRMHHIDGTETVWLGKETRPDGTKQIRLMTLYPNPIGELPINGQG